MSDPKNPITRADRFWHPAADHLGKIGQEIVKNGQLFDQNRPKNNKIRLKMRQKHRIERGIFAMKVGESGRYGSRF